MESRRRQMAEGRSRAGALGALWAAVFPHFCVDCGQEGNILCVKCEVKNMAQLRAMFYCPGCGEGVSALGRCGQPGCECSPLDGLVSAASYAAPALRSLLHQYKYGGVDEAGTSLVRLFGHALSAERAALEPIFSGAKIIPAPLHSFRFAKRGFNQSDRLAAIIAKNFSGRVDRSMLGRRFRLTAQAKITSVEKRALSASGSVFAKHRVSGTVVLADDVATTMSTLKACALELRAAGAEQVYAATVLRG